MIRRSVCALLLGLGLTAAQAGELPSLITTLKPSLIIVGSYDETDSPRFQFRGTGFVVEGDHLAVTNVHVLPPAVEEGGDESRRQVSVLVRDAGGNWTRRDASVVSTDSAHDLALLHFEGAPAPAVMLDDRPMAVEGSDIILMGFPLGGALGFSVVTHRGIVSSIAPIALPAPGSGGLNARAVRQLREGSFDILQLDAVAYPGNSGGPVIDVASGRVVGIVNMVLVKGSRESAIGSPTGISYAIPVRYVRQLMSEGQPGGR